MRHSLVLLLLLIAAPAFAGSVGAYGVGGLHAGTALDAGGGTGVWGDVGAGAEVVLGPRDSRLLGRLRFGWQGVIQGAEVQHVGTLSAGVLVHLLPDLEGKVGLYLGVDAGVSPLVKHLRLFGYAAVGPGVELRPHERIGIFVEAAGMLRFEKTFAGGPLVSAGLRVTFD